MKAGDNLTKEQAAEISEKARVLHGDVIELFAKDPAEPARFELLQASVACSLLANEFMQILAADIKKERGL